MPSTLHSVLVIVLLHTTNKGGREGREGGREGREGGKDGGREGRTEGGRKEGE